MFSSLKQLILDQARKGYRICANMMETNCRPAAAKDIPPSPDILKSMLPNSNHGFGLSKLVNGSAFQPPMQFRIRVPSFHNASSQGGLSDTENVYSGSGNDYQFSQTQATQPPTEENETQVSPPRPQGPSMDVWGRLIPIEDFAKTEVTAKSLVGPSPFKIGRGSGSQLHINDLTVSSRHCTIVMDESNGNACIIDHRSSNGTYVNHERLEPEKKFYLSHGDCVSLVAPGKSFTVTNHANDNEAPSQKKPRTIARSVGFTMVYHTVPPPLNFAEDAIRKAPRVFTSKYALIQELGKGNFAVVYKGISRETGENVAVKVIERARFLKMPVARFSQQVKEAEVLRKLDHPYIVAFRDLIHTDDALYVVTELLQGGELFDRLIQKGAYSEARAKILMRKVLDAVAYLHDRGIVHRDLKPENIVMRTVDDDTDVKVVDFGVATELAQGGRGKTFCGSLSYVAPEVLRRRGSVMKQGSYREAVDMWSIGVVVCVMLTLRPPFDEEDDAQMHATLHHVLKFDTPEWRGISQAAKDFVKSCFELKEEKRITAKQALEHPWLKL